MDRIEAINQAASTSITIIPPSLLNIPTEIRRNIFKHLLLNTELAEASSIDEDQRYGADLNYDLSPQVLLVCRLFHEEGKEILYGLNHFIVESLPNIHPHEVNTIHPFTLCSPLTRWDNQPTTHLPTNSTQKTSLHRNRGIRLVRKWRIVLSARLHQPRSQDGLVELCRLLCELQILSGGTLLRELDICIIPKGAEFNYGYLDAADMRENLLPLELLRNIPRVSIRTASISEIPDFVCRDDWSKTPLVTKSMLPAAPYRHLLIDLIQGNSEVELSTKMFTALLKYAQAFERHFEYRQAMSLSFEEVASSITREFTALSHNPFLSQEFHPKALAHTVEAGLQKARYMTEKESGDITKTTKFKEERSVILKYLERQFCRISHASQEIVDFVKLQKRKWGIFDPACTKEYNGFDMVIYTEAMVLIENYVASFTRELDASTKMAVRVQFGLFEHRYASMSREFGLKKCLVAYSRSDPIAFRAYFQEVVVDADFQYFTILTARSKLYDWDACSNVPDIKVTQLGSLEAWEIRWHIEEPTITAITESEAQKMQDDLRRQIVQTKFLAQQEAGYQAPQGSHTVDGDGTNGQDANIENNAGENHLAEMELDDLANWESLPYHDDDEFYELTFQWEGNQSRAPNVNPISSDSASENDFYEKLFRDHPDDESFGLESEDEDIHKEDCVNSGGVVFHVLPWLANCESSLSHVFPWMTRSQQ
ncbi:uncharacterized protein EAE98_001611 [Botrytis deweyae]|uniref:F-box domain-containing protein n=1 Tax=Botrytis deweyae TaxID=2478750 RepID=A0ABQ7IYB5_9HELO|nr:uncharacterized protein EAE98_001611 [Botrytis deweyae]KAF7937297.1 hypothetical protein EAE98_001611 [Botrytis deweyae]